MDLDQQRITAVHLLQSLGYTYCDGEWILSAEVRGWKSRDGFRTMTNLERTLASILRAIAKADAAGPSPMRATLVRRRDAICAALANRPRSPCAVRKGIGPLDH
jgi:hypothetical protein